MLRFDGKEAFLYTIVTGDETRVETGNVGNKSNEFMKTLCKQQNDLAIKFLYFQSYKKEAHDIITNCLSFHDNKYPNLIKATKKLHNKLVRRKRCSTNEGLKTNVTAEDLIRTHDTNQEHKS